MKAATAPNPVHIGKVVRYARIFNFRDPQEEAVSDSSLVDAVDRLFALLAEQEVDYLLVGGIALLQYVEGRNTDNIDLIIDLASMEKIPEIRRIEEDQNFVRGDYDGVQIDLRLTSNPVFEIARRRYATKRRFVEREIPCATPEGLVLLKLYALPSLYRQGDFTRVALYETDALTLMQRYGIDTELLFTELEDHLSRTDLDSLRKITNELRQRIERFGQEFR